MFSICVSSDEGATWSMGEPEGGMYMQAYNEAKLMSQERPDLLWRVRNVETKSWLVCFKDGQIVQVEPVEPGAAYRGLIM